jgi:hypothetical protein
MEDVIRIFVEGGNKTCEKADLTYPNLIALIVSFSRSIWPS